MDHKDIDSIAVFGIWPAEFPSAGAFELAQGVFDAARQINREFRERAGTLRQSGRLTKLGMTQELTAYAAEQLGALERAAASHLGKARAELANLETKLRGVPATTDTAARAIREAEVRERLLKVDEARRMAILSDAIERGEEIVVAAFLGAPRFIQQDLLALGLLDQARERWESMRAPETASQVRMLRRAIETAERAVATAKRSILTDGAVDPQYSEALQMMA